MHVISGNDNGGGGQHVLNICSINGKGFQNFLCCIGKGPLYEKSKIVNINKYYVENIKDKKILEIIKNRGIDIINFHGPKANFMHLYFKNKIKKPCVTTVHSDFRYDFLNNKLKYIFYTPLNVHALRGFSNFVCVSESLKVLLDEKGFKGNKTVVRNGIDMDKIKISRTSEEIRNTLKLGKNDFVYILVARMHPVKNHINLIKAFAKLKKEFESVKLILVGDGVLYNDIRKLISDLNLDKDIILTGYRDDSIDFVNSADISMLTSFSEGGIPTLTFLESAAAKKSIICSDIGDFSRILSEEYGFLIDPDSIESIYQKMKEAYIKRPYLPSMGNKLNAFVSENYSLKKLAESYYEVYKNIMGK